MALTFFISQPDWRYRLMMVVRIRSVTVFYILDRQVDLHREACTGKIVFAEKGIDLILDQAEDFELLVG